MIVESSVQSMKHFLTSHLFRNIQMIGQLRYQYDEYHLKRIIVIQSISIQHSTAHFCRILILYRHRRRPCLLPKQSSHSSQIARESQTLVCDFHFPFLFLQFSHASRKVETHSFSFNLLFIVPIHINFH